MSKKSNKPVSGDNHSSKRPKRGLGRGFDSLIPTQLVEEEFDPTLPKDEQGRPLKHQEVVDVATERIDPNPHQPRQEFNEKAISELAASIKQHGILQPLVVTAAGSRYELIAGERRLRAAKQLGLKTVPVIVRSFDEQQKLELALIENLQREDLNVIETATAYRKLIDEFGLSLSDIAKRVGRDSSTISNTMRLLNLPIEAKRALTQGKIVEGHGRAILAVPDPKKQLELLELIVKHSWTVGKAETFARSAKQGESTERAAKRAQTTNAYTEALGRALNTKVSLRQRARGGQLIVEYKSDQDLERITKQLGA